MYKRQVSMDNYFNTVDPETAPRSRDGSIDYESPFCLDIELLNRHFSMLDRGETIHVPKYEFSRQMRSDIFSQPMHLGADDLATVSYTHLPLFPPATLRYRSDLLWSDLLWAQRAPARPSSSSN